jgi:small-conductance mechanosensitive channel/CRP-like cAMP-binding protein
MKSNRLSQVDRRLIGAVIVNLVLSCISLNFLNTLLGWESALLQPFEGLNSRNLFAFGQFIGFAFLADRLMRAALSGQGQSGGPKRTPKIALYFLQALIYVIFLSLGLRLVFGQSVETVLAASGIFSLVLGFALRGLVSDIFYGIALHLDENISPDDWLEISYRGVDYVAKLGEFDWRYTILLDYADNAIMIPNSEFAHMVVKNFSRPTSGTEFVAKLEVPLLTNHFRILAILKNAAEHAAQLGFIAENPGPYVRLTTVTRGVGSFSIFFWLPAAANRFRARHFVMESALAFLRAAGVSLQPVLFQHRLNDISASENPSQDVVRKSILAKVPFFSGLSEAELNDLSAGASDQSFRPGDTVIAVDEPGSSMFVVVEGRLDVSVPDSHGGHHSVGRIWPGEVFGEMSVFLGAPRKATVMASLATVVLEISKPTIEKIIVSNPALVNSFADVIEKRLLQNEAAIADTKDQGPAQESGGQTLFKRIAVFFGIS